MAKIRLFHLPCLSGDYTIPSVAVITLSGVERHLELGKRTLNAYNNQFELGKRTLNAYNNQFKCGGVIIS